MRGCHPYVLVIGTAQIVLLHRGRAVMRVIQGDKAAHDALLGYCQTLSPSTFIVAFHDDQVILRTEAIPPLLPTDRMKLILRRMRQQFDGLCGWNLSVGNQIRSYGLQHAAAFTEWKERLSRHLCYPALLPLEAGFLSGAALQDKNILVIAETESSGLVHYVVRDGEVIFFRLTGANRDERFLEDALATRDYTPRLGIDKSSLHFALLSADTYLQQDREVLLRSHAPILGLPTQTASVDETMAAGLMKGNIRHPIHGIAMPHLFLSWVTPLRAMRCAQIICATLLLGAACLASDTWGLYRQCQQFERLNKHLASAPAVSTDPRLKQARERFRLFHEPAANPAALLQQFSHVAGDQLLSRFSWRRDSHKKAQAELFVRGMQDAAAFMQQAHDQMQAYSVEDADKDWLSSIDGNSSAPTEHHLRLVQR